jgi:exopolyphosphatase/guanosine-5'-triphosphate,3'-diphosphate pyrophosphatase
MTLVHIAVADHGLVVDLHPDATADPGHAIRSERVSFTLPIGLAALSEHELHTDPPRPEELTNAIGLVADHLDDVVRADPSVIGAATSLAGAELCSIVGVEVGGAPTLPFVLSRDAAEDVFRTVATEPLADRRHNPGLAAEHVHSVVPAACAVVAVMRRLQLLEVTIIEPVGPS